MSEVDDIRSMLQALLYNINQEITSVVNTRDATKTTAEALLALRSNNDNVIGAAAKLMGISQTLDSILPSFKVAVQSVEEYIRTI